MKYEAKHYNGSTTIPVSTASGLPWVNIAQSLTDANNDAIEISQNAVDQSGNPITGAHLITEAEWMTVAQNVLSVASNWSNGTIGSGFIYNGHVDNHPTSSLAASDDDTNSNYGEDTYNNSNVSANNKRTLTLTNGEVIWDLAGNVWEWTAGQTSGVGNQPGITGAGLGWREWTAISNPGNLIPNPSPAGTGISGSNNWGFSTSVGLVYSSSVQVLQRGFVRSGGWGSGYNAGVLSLRFDYSPTEAAYSYIGFRVSR